MSWEVDEEVNQDKNGEADGMNLEVDVCTQYIEWLNKLNNHQVNRFVWNTSQRMTTGTAKLAPRSLQGAATWRI